MDNTVIVVRLTIVCNPFWSIFEEIAFLIYQLNKQIDTKTRILMNFNNVIEDPFLRTQVGTFILTRPNFRENERCIAH